MVHSDLDPDLDQGLNRYKGLNPDLDQDLCPDPTTDPAINMCPDTDLYQDAGPDSDLASLKLNLRFFMVHRTPVQDLGTNKGLGIGPDLDL
jgi:hypothetical protein